jgi:hypothetical protein
MQRSLIISRLLCNTPCSCTKHDWSITAGLDSGAEGDPVMGRSSYWSWDAHDVLNLDLFLQFIVQVLLSANQLGMRCSWCTQSGPFSTIHCTGNQVYSIGIYWSLDTHDVLNLDLFLQFIVQVLLSTNQLGMRCPWCTQSGPLYR